LSSFEQNFNKSTFFSTFAAPLIGGAFLLIIS
jgi:hypothetical protein